MNIEEHLETHHAKNSAKYIKNIIFGGIDGIITTFSILSGLFWFRFEHKIHYCNGICRI